MLNKGPALILWCWILLLCRTGSECFVAPGVRAQGKDNFNLTSSSFNAQLKPELVFSVSGEIKSGSAVLCQELLCVHTYLGRAETEQLEKMSELAVFFFF